MLSEAILQEHVEPDLFLAYEARLRERTGEEEIDHRADARRSRPLNRAPPLPGDGLGIDLAHIGRTSILATLHATRCTEDDDHILESARDRTLQDIDDELPLFGQTQLLQEELHQLAVTRVADRLVRQLAHFALQRVAERAEPARRVEGFVLIAVDDEMLDALQRFNRAHLSVDDCLTRLAVLVDQPFWRPGDVIAKRIGWMLRKRTDFHLDALELIEPVGQRRGYDRNKAWCQAALRHEDLTVRGALRDRLDALGVGDILSEIEVAHPCT